MEKICIKTDYIKLDQFLKWTGIVINGSDAKDMIFEGIIQVNNETEIRRGRKLRNGDIIKVLDREFVIEQGEVIED